METQELKPMCSGAGCPRAYKCAYTKAFPEGVQKDSRFATPPIKPDGKCDMFWPIMKCEDEKF